MSHCLSYGLVSSFLSRRLVYPSRGHSDYTYHVDADDLTGGLLDLLETAHEVPVSRLGDDLVGGEDPHAVQRRGGVGLGRQMPADDLVLLKTTWSQSC